MAPQARIAVTSGEPAGVGPDLCLQLARGPLPCELICLGDRELLVARARQLSLKLNLWDRLQTALMPLCFGISLFLGVLSWKCRPKLSEPVAPSQLFE